MDNHLVVADRSERGKLRFTGPQAKWFLHQIMSQAFEDMASGEARDTAMLTPHGRMVGYMETLAGDDAIYAHFEPELRATLPGAIEEYVFATQVTIDDVSDESGLVLVAGEGWEAAAIKLDVLVHPTRSLGVPGAYLWLERARVPDAVAALQAGGARVASEDELESIRIEHGVPRWGRDMDTKTIPQEAGIEEWAVHFDKGCYTGQEAMAKIHFRGKVNRRLARLQGDSAIGDGGDVLLGGDKVGVVTSASDGSALALLKHTVQPGASVVVDGVSAAVIG